MKNIMVTGGCCFIGSSFLQMALKQLCELNAECGHGITIEQVVPAIRSLLCRNRA